MVRNQLRLMPALDEGVGRVLKALEDSMQLENTIIIFTSDHGYFWGEHGLTEKRFAYDEALRVPLLVRYPARIKAGTTSDQTVLSIDIAPTLLALGGAPTPAAVQGRSFASLLGGSAPPDWRTAFLSEFEPTAKEPLPAWQAVRTQDWKYIHYRGVKDMDELYHLKDDPLERKNLIREPGSQADRKAMEAHLQKLLKASGGDKPAAPRVSDNTNKKNEQPN
jgi:N-acetylglucosamine-6-sulfatase